VAAQHPEGHEDRHCQHDSRYSPRPGPEGEGKQDHHRIDLHAAAEEGGRDDLRFKPDQCAIDQRRQQRLADAVEHHDADGGGEHQSGDRPEIGDVVQDEGKQGPQVRCGQADGPEGEPHCRGEPRVDQRDRDQIGGNLALDVEHDAQCRLLVLEARKNPDELFVEQVSGRHEEHGDHDGAARHEDDVDRVTCDQGEDRRQHRLAHDDLLHIRAGVGGCGILDRLADADQACEGGSEACDLSQKFALQAGRVFDPLQQRARKGEYRDGGEHTGHDHDCSRGRPGGNAPAREGAHQGPQRHGDEESENGGHQKVAGKIDSGNGRDQQKARQQPPYVQQQPAFTGRCLDFIVQIRPMRIRMTTTIRTRPNMPDGP
jgi:hypothetical protein